jgi:hypothetical protein
MAIPLHKAGKVDRPKLQADLVRLQIFHPDLLTAPAAPSTAHASPSMTASLCAASKLPAKALPTLAIALLSQTEKELLATSELDVSPASLAEHHSDKRWREGGRSEGEESYS